MSIEKKIKEKSVRNTELLSILHETENAVPAFEAQKRYVADLEQQVADAAKKLEELGRKRKKELKEHEAYQKSIMKRFAYKVSGQKEKFKAEAEKEEREYFEAVQEEHQAGVLKENIESMLTEAKTAQQTLSITAQKHTEAQQELDTIYDSIFSGPTPDFPEEDFLETALKSALESHHYSQHLAESEHHAIQLLARAITFLKRAESCMKGAKHASKADMWGGGGFMDMMERDELSKADERMRSARDLIQQAQRHSAAVKDLPRVKISQGNIMGDVLFDNIFSDMAFHDKIVRGETDVKQCTVFVEAELEAAKGRHRELLEEAEVKSAVVKEARLKLQKARQAAFERVG
ncbi:hypothetical protein HK097_003475 [Rhizophlyctis rosea]|uniref:Uncharacterized protein n=1 Tax=Rhizophlyctis rosea TaxID=64517 RepID=A0AAD5SFW1_9FUNG|nr:hypothetical protein HK097_003475 [Rhizophlyctis rosea]